MVNISFPPAPPIRLALVNDYDLVLAGVARMFDTYTERVEVIELDASMRVAQKVHVALYDSFAQPESDHSDIEALVENPHAQYAVVYTWNFDQRLVDSAFTKGASGYLSKTLPAKDLVEAIERIFGGEQVISPPPSGQNLSVGGEWPGRSEGLSERESEILALITQGKSNAEIAGLVYLSINSIKSYIRSIYRKIGARNRVDAVLWGVDNGFRPDYSRITNWRD